MKPHLVVHGVVLALLLLIGGYAGVRGWSCVSLRDFVCAGSYALAVFSSLFGIYKTERYHRNVANGCEITVTTAEAKLFPYMLYGVCAVLGVMGWLKGLEGAFQNELKLWTTLGEAFQNELKLWATLGEAFQNELKLWATLGGER